MKSKAAKLGGRIERELLRAQRAALEDLRNKQADPAYEAEKWEDRSTRTVINMKFAEQAAAMVRATKAADAGPRMLGFVVGVNLIPDPAKWEEAAKAVEAGKQVIEVEATGGVPQENVHGTRRAIGSVQEQLRKVVREEGETSGEKEEEQGPEEARLLTNGGGR